MKAKKIVFAVMCSLLALVIILTGVVAVQVNRMLKGFTNPDASTETTTSPTQSSTPDTTAQPTDTIPDDTTVPTAPSAPADSTFPTEENHVHNFVLTESVQASCNTYGYNIYTCECGKQEIPQAEQVEPLGHNYGAGEVIEATCTEDGCTRAVCSRCRDVKTWDIVPATGHAYAQTEMKEATCSEAGYSISVCTNCGDEQMEEIEKLAHNPEPVEIVDATCTEDGYTLYVCGICGEEEKKDIISASGHVLSGWKKGVRTCSYCDLTETYQDLYITNELVSGSEIINYKLYRVSIGTDNSAEDFVYDICDYVNNGTMTYHYDADQGLIITYEENGQYKTVVLAPATSTSADIRPEPEPVLPTEPPTETPTEAPTQPQQTESPTEPAPTESQETEPTQQTESPADPTDSAEPQE